MGEGGVGIALVVCCCCGLPCVVCAAPGRGLGETSFVPFVRNREEGSREGKKREGQVGGRQGGRGIWRREEGGAFDCCVSLFYAAYLGEKIRQSMQSRQIKWVFFLFIISEFFINSSISYVGDFFLLFGAISSRANDEKSFLILLRANWCGSSKAAGRLLLGI